MSRELIGQTLAPRPSDNLIQAINDQVNQSGISSNAVVSKSCEAQAALYSAVVLSSNRQNESSSAASSQDQMIRISSDGCCKSTHASGGETTLLNITSI